VVRHVTVSGLVLGVGFRSFVDHEARARGLEGWVRNLRDGNVEAVFSGAEDVVAAMVATCRRGPSLARVEAVQEEAASIDQLNLRRAAECFSVLPTI
jgi:acylphosphatase